MTRFLTLVRRSRVAGALALAALVSPGVAAGQSLVFAGDTTRAAGPDLRPLVVLGADTLRVVAFEQAYLDHLLATGDNDAPSVRRAFLDEWVDRHLLAREAARRGLDRTPQYRAGLDGITRLAAAGRLIEREAFETLPAPTDAELRWAFVHAHTTLDVRVLFYRSEPEARAAHTRLDAGADFVALAAENRAFAAVDSMAGFLGRVTYAGVDDAFAEAAFRAPVGAHTAPIRTRLGWYIVRVENARQTALLTEDAYAARRVGLESQVRQRRRRLAGDRYVQQFMAPLGVQVDARALNALAPDLRAAADATSARALLADLRGDAVLARYTQAGTSHAFTVAQFAAWLPLLPFAEVKTNPAAALGRALRNEVFAREGLARGLDQDLEARLEIDRWRVATLSAQTLDAIAQEPAPMPEERLVREAFLRLRLGEDGRTAYEDVRDHLATTLRADLHRLDVVRGLRAGASVLIDPALLVHLAARAVAR